MNDMQIAATTPANNGNVAYGTIDANPVKRFFVQMLTRDISIEDAILDLLDNCLDGVVRSLPPDPDSPTPYNGYWAKITVEADSFEIEDN